MESPSGMTRTPPLDSALATPSCSATAAATAATHPADSHLTRARITYSSRSPGGRGGLGEQAELPQQCRDRRRRSIAPGRQVHVARKVTTNNGADRWNA